MPRDPRDHRVSGVAMILPSVTIGDDAIIGASSVVTRDVPPAASLLAIRRACVVMHSLSPLRMMGDDAVRQDAATLAAAFAELPQVVAVALGGSRALGQRVQEPCPKILFPQTTPLWERPEVTGMGHAFPPFTRSQNQFLQSAFP